MPATRLRIFVSSVQKEFPQIRKDLKAFLLGDAVLRRFIADVFLFEDLPASDRRADDVYLDEVKRCDVFLGIYGNDYGAEDKDGLSPTECEYRCATQHRKTRLAFVWVKKHGRITNSDYQRLAGTNRKTSARDLDTLVVKGVFRRVGEKRGSQYVLGEKK